MNDVQKRLVLPRVVLLFISCFCSAHYPQRPEMDVIAALPVDWLSIQVVLIFQQGCPLFLVRLKTLQWVASVVVRSKLGDDGDHQHFFVFEGKNASILKK